MIRAVVAITRSERSRFSF